MRLSIVAGLAAALAGSAASAGALSVTKAWVAPTDAVGADVVLSLKLTNGGADPDALVRAACPFANFSEKRTIDHGEGGVAARAVPSIPIPANGELTLAGDGDHVALLQVREPLVEGARYACKLSFRNAGPIEIPVTISRSEPGS